MKKLVCFHHFGHFYKKPVKITKKQFFDKKGTPKGTPKGFPKRNQMGPKYLMDISWILDLDIECWIFGYWIWILDNG